MVGVAVHAGEPTYRHRALESYQAGREFDTELIDQLEVLPEFVAACGFANAKAPGYEADDFLAAAVAKGERRGTVLVATGDRDAYQLASAKTTILQPIKAGEWRGSVPLRCASVMAWRLAKSPTSSPGVATHPTRYRAPRAPERGRRPAC
jgi:5'-3' exonuclease